NKHKLNKNTQKHIINNKLTIELLEIMELENLNKMCNEWNLNIIEKNKLIEVVQLEKWMNKYKLNQNIKKNIINNELTIKLVEKIELEDLKGISKEWNLNFTEKSKFIDAVELLTNSKLIIFVGVII